MTFFLIVQPLIRTMGVFRKVCLLLICSLNHLICKVAIFVEQVHSVKTGNNFLASNAMKKFILVLFR